MAGTAILILINVMMMIQLGNSCTTVSPGSCNRHETYSSKSQSEVIFDGLKLQERILARTDYDIGPQLLPSLYEADDNETRKMILSLLELWDIKNSLLSSNLVLQHINPTIAAVIEDTCTWLRAHFTNLSPECTASELKDLKRTLDLYQIIHEAVVGEDDSSTRSPIEKIHGNALILSTPNDMCDYWSVHILGNCTQPPTLVQAQLHNTVFVEDLVTWCRCQSGTETSICSVSSAACA